jgi:hypothetical protein
VTARRVGRMPLLAIGAAWCAAAAVAAVAVGRAIRLRDEQPVPQLDDPLRRGTDLDPGPTPSESLAGSILALAYATDETTARYWLAVCARRGADWSLQRQLWDRWQAEHRPTVIYLDPPQNGDHP